ncbi:MAG: ATP-binding protein [Thermoanaerobaculum sp.]|nr:ATP-binding protein [Thermoanaerobaculum sp.]MDW7967496.1 ATP-binding protein [Thermoanaerobaculum sp.]
MKVALIGTHGVGKTTLCYELAARLKRRDVDVELVREVARHCPLPINRQTNEKAQSWILHTQMAWELEAEARHFLVLCDRSVLDNYCYLLYAEGPQPHWEPLLSRWLSTYHLLVKVPLWTPPSWDGVRDTDLGFQRAIDQLLEQEISRRGLHVLHLPLHQRSLWGDLVMQALDPFVLPIPPLFPEEEKPLP